MKQKVMDGSTVGRWVKAGLCPLYMAMAGWSVNVKLIMAQQAHVQLQDSCCPLKLALAEVGEDIGRYVVLPRMGIWHMRELRESMCNAML